MNWPERLPPNTLGAAALLAGLLVLRHYRRTPAGWIALRVAAGLGALFLVVLVGYGLYAAAVVGARAEGLAGFRRGLAALAPMLALAAAAGWMLWRNRRR